MQTIIRRSFRTLPIAAALLVASLPAAAMPQDEARIWRAAIADAQEKVIRVWDLGEREEVGVFKTGAAARLHPAAGSMEFTVIESATGDVRTLHLGLKEEDHGDHNHWVTAKPKLSATLLNGPRPSHANVGAGRVAVFFDGDGTLRSHALAVLHATARAHHGIGIPLPGERLLVSRPAAEGSLPDGMQVVDSNGSVQMASPVCEAQHGDGQHHPMYLFGCKNGLLLYDDKRNTFELIPYRLDTDKGMVRTLISTPKNPRWVGNFGKEALLLIDVEQRSQTLVPLPAALLDFQWDPDSPSVAYALVRSGELLAIDTKTGKVLGRRAVLPEWSPPETTGNSPPSPRLAVASDRIALVDPRSGLLHFLRGKDLKTLDEIKLGGQPGGIVMRSVNLDPD